jgi:hypothetical protein
MLLLCYFLVVAITTSLFFREYKIHKNYIFLNLFTYLVILSGFYFVLPSFILNYFGEPITGTRATEKATLIGLSYHSIFLIYFIISNKYLKKRRLQYRFNPMNNINLKLPVIMIAGLVSLYLILLILMNYSSFVNAGGKRVLLVAIDQLFIFKYKLYYFSNLLILCILYLFFTTGKKRYILLFLPFVFYSILISDRDFLLKFLFLALFCLSFANVFIKIRWLVLPLILFILTSFFRGRSQVNGLIEDYNLIFGEFIYTWITTAFVEKSNLDLNLFELFTFSLFKIFPPNTYELLFGKFDSYTLHLNDISTLHFGLSGSLVSEVLAYNSVFLILITPILIGFYGLIVNRLLFVNILSIKIIFPMCVLVTHSFIRSSFYQYALYPIGLMFTLGLWIILIDLLNSQRKVK